MQFTAPLPFRTSRSPPISLFLVQDHPQRILGSSTGNLNTIPPSSHETRGQRIGPVRRPACAAGPRRAGRAIHSGPSNHSRICIVANAPGSPRSPAVFLDDAVGASGPRSEGALRGRHSGAAHRFRHNSDPFVTSIPQTVPELRQAPRRPFNQLASVDGGAVLLTAPSPCTAWSRRSPSVWPTSAPRKDSATRGSTRPAGSSATRAGHPVSNDADHLADDPIAQAAARAGLALAVREPRSPVRERRDPHRAYRMGRSWPMRHRAAAACTGRRASPSILGSDHDLTTASLTFLNAGTDGGVCRATTFDREAQYLCAAVAARQRSGLRRRPSGSAAPAAAGARFRGRRFLVRRDGSGSEVFAPGCGAHSST